MTVTASTLENLTLNLTHDVHVRASLDATFDADGRVWGTIAGQHMLPKAVTIDAAGTSETLGRVRSSLATTRDQSTT